MSHAFIPGRRDESCAASLLRKDQVGGSNSTSNTEKVKAYWKFESIIALARPFSFQDILFGIIWAFTSGPDFYNCYKWKLGTHSLATIIVIHYSADLRNLSSTCLSTKVIALSKKIILFINCFQSCYGLVLVWSCRFASARCSTRPASSSAFTCTRLSLSSDITHNSASPCNTLIKHR